MDEQEKTRRIQAWLDLIEANEEFLMAGIRRRLGPDAEEADIWAERRRLYEKWADEHDANVRYMAQRIGGALKGHG